MARDLKKRRISPRSYDRGIREIEKWTVNEKKELFHHFVAKCLFLCKRARPDIHPAIAFLTTRVQSPDEDDWKKLGRVMKYIKKTIYMPLTLEGDNIHIIKWWVDASYAPHQDMKSHTGATMTLGQGCPITISSKQKINTKKPFVIVER